MRANNGGPTQVTTNLAFSAFLFSMFGWALFQTQLFKLVTGFRIQLLTFAYGCVVSGIAIHRCRLSWFVFVYADTHREGAAPCRHLRGDVASCVALVAAGCLLALCMQPRSIVFFALCAGAFSLVPWSKFGFCRRHFCVSCSLLAAGAISVFLV